MDRYDKAVSGLQRAGRAKNMACALAQFASSQQSTNQPSICIRCKLFSSQQRYATLLDSNNEGDNTFLPLELEVSCCVS